MHRFRHWHRKTWQCREVQHPMVAVEGRLMSSSHPLRVDAYKINNGLIVMV